MARILITGGTGRLGQAVIPLAGDHTIRIGSRRPRPADLSPEVEWATIDIISGAGVAEALDGVEIVLHAASNAGNANVDVDGTRYLLEVTKTAGVRHFVFPSIVGIDLIPFNYYRNKYAAERIIEAGGVPFTIARITQFHEFIDLVFQGAARVPAIMPLPARFKSQPVAVSEAAAHITQCIADGPGGRVADFAGPEVHALGDLARRWLAVRQKRKVIVRIPLFGKMAGAFRAGQATNPDQARGTITWKDWLRERYGET